MPDVTDLQDVPLPSYALRVKTKFRGVFKSESGLVSQDEKSALLEIKERFDLKDSIDNWETYYLVKRIWNLPILKGSEMIVEESPLEIKKIGKYNWSVERADDFVKVP